VTSGLAVSRPRPGVAELRLARPAQRNALDTELLSALYRELLALGEDPGTRVVVLSGEGPTFCAGADLSEFAGTSPDPTASLARLRLVVRCVRELLSLEQVTIAVVHGVAVGAGWGLALGCDLCWAVDGTRFSLPEVAKGFRLPRVIVERLTQVVGPVRAAEIVLTGDTIEADGARSLGLVTRVHTDVETARATAIELAAGLAAGPVAPLRGATEPLRLLGAPGAVPEIDYQWPER